MTFQHSSSAATTPDRPQTSRFHFWQKWLVAASELVILFGLFTTFLHRTVLFAPFHAQVNPVFWDTAVSPSALAFQGWAYSLLGAVMVGWGICLFSLAHTPFKQREMWAWNSLFYGLLAWYVLDTAVSLQYGVVFNAMVNTFFLVLFLVPLTFTRKAFKGGS